MEETDLPLLSNIHDVRARHYLLYFETDIVNRMISGTTIIFFNLPTSCELANKFCSENCSCLKRANSEGLGSLFCPKGNETNFPIILECNNLIIKYVEELMFNADDELNKYFDPNYLKNNVKDYKNWNQKTREALPFTQDKWSITIEGRRPFCASDFPKVICISFLTNYKGESISWRKCIDGETCFFTAGSFINNRSVFPSQDRPLAMATWQAWVTVPLSYYVSMTGDKTPEILNSNQSFYLGNDKLTEKQSCFYYYSTMILPTATIALAVGKWEVYNLFQIKEVEQFNKKYMTSSKMYQDILPVTCNHMIYPCHMTYISQGPLVPVTLVCASSLMDKAKNLLKFLKFIHIASYKLMGMLPFSRLEIVILPRCFPNLGLASPNVIYLSKSLLMDDSSLYLRLAHELSHSWFGIIIGPQNWEEEWLSEGFATYLEDIFYAIAVEESLKEEKGAQLSKNLEEIIEKYNSLFHLRGHLRFLTLLSENENSSEELQVMLPYSLTSTLEQSFVKNGMNSDKAFLQVHYLKGYFLLHMLSKSVSRASFDLFLGMTASKFHGQLITSSDFLNFFYEHFPDKLAIIPKMQILNDWLINPNINKDISKSFGKLSESNPLYITVIKHYRFWLKFDGLTGNNSSFKKENKNLSNFKLIYSDQIVLLFENLLKWKKFKVKTLRQIYFFYQVKSRNIDIQHRWCELIIKHNYPDSTFISEFLKENQSMGVYLYGELMISGREHYKKIAHEIYSELKEEMDSKSKDVISSMIFGT